MGERYRTVTSAARSPRRGAGLAGTIVALYRVIPFDFKRKETAMHLLWSLVIGLIVGAVAKLLMPGKDPGGIVVTMLLGIAGSLLANFLGRALHIYRATGTGPGIIASIIGAMILLGIYRAVIGRRTTRTTTRLP
jgi:uncharacterized membrane protein YeaQ/YmgE (transglycosylase-associated protein family)